MVANRSLTPDQIEQIRRQLRKRLETLYRHFHAEVRDEMVGSEEPFPKEDPKDESDEALRVQLNDLRVRLAEGEASRAQAIEAALLRIAMGEFGSCIDCGEPIEARRLLSVPETPRCRDCQERVEQEAKQLRAEAGNPSLTL
jgi:DnaK suppressor protein